MVTVTHTRTTPARTRRETTDIMRMLGTIQRCRRMLRQLVETINDAALDGIDSDVGMGAYNDLAATEAALREAVTEQRWQFARRDRRQGDDAVASTGGGVTGTGGNAGGASAGSIGGAR